MTRKTITAASDGVVTEIVQTGTTWKVRVEGPNSLAIYTDLNDVAVLGCQSVRVGDIIGYQETGVVVNNDVWSEPIYYDGNGTNTFHDDRLKGALAVKWWRAGIFKRPGQAADSYSFDPLNGNINSNEAQSIYEWFAVQYKSA